MHEGAQVDELRKIAEQLAALDVTLAGHTAREEAFWVAQREANDYNRTQYEMIMAKLELRLVAETEMKAQVKQLSRDAGQRGAIMGSVVGGLLVALLSGLLAMGIQQVARAVAPPPAAQRTPNGGAGGQ